MFMQSYTTFIYMVAFKALGELLLPALAPPRAQDI